MSRPVIRFALVVTSLLGSLQFPPGRRRLSSPTGSFRGVSWLLRKLLFLFVSEPKVTDYWRLISLGRGKKRVRDRSVARCNKVAIFIRINCHRFIRGVARQCTRNFDIMIRRDTTVTRYFTLCCAKRNRWCHVKGILPYYRIVTKL